MKSGIKTTEFWISILGVVGPVLAVIMDKIPQDGALYTILGSVAAVIAYVSGRSFVKGKVEEKKE